MDTIEKLCNITSNKELADLSFINEKSVKFRLTAIYRKAGVKGRYQFVTKYKDYYKPVKDIIGGDFIPDPIVEPSNSLLPRGLNGTQQVG